MDIRRGEWPRLDGLLIKSRLINVISDLKNSADIEGVVLIGDKNNIIASDLPKRKNYHAEIPEILSRRQQWYDSTKILNGMFAHCIMDYNGYKVLAKRLKHDLTLLVMLQKQGYIGLAMLDIENSVREIHGILKGGANQKSAN